MKAVYSWHILLVIGCEFVVGEFYFTYNFLLICVGGLCTFISTKGLCGGYVVLANTLSKPS